MDKQDCKNIALTVLMGSPMFQCSLRRKEFPKRCNKCPKFEQKDKCPECKGRGKDYGVGGFDADFADCPACEGTGLIGGSGINDRCDDCNGTGKQKDNREKIAVYLWAIVSAFTHTFQGKEYKDWDKLTEEQRSLVYPVANKIIALFPDELGYNPDYLDFQKGVEATRKIWKVKVEEAKQAAFDKGVKRGTTIRNINWCSENHERHGRKMAKAKGEAKREERERIDISLNALEKQAQGRGLVNRGMRHAVEILRQALKEGKR